MIREYFKMKKTEYRLKSMLYSTIHSLFHEKDGILALLQKLGENPNVSMLTTPQKRNR